MAFDLFFESLPIGARFVFDILRSKVAKSPNVPEEILNVISPKLDQVHSAVEDLKLRDQNVAQTRFVEVLHRFKNKLESSLTDSCLREESKEIEGQLEKAKEKALEANNSNLGVTETLLSFEWILDIEILMFLNLVTSTKEPNDQDRQKIQPTLLWTKPHH